MLKILVTGTTSAGKTTLLQALAEKNIAHVVVIPELARKLLTEQPELEQDPRFQDILFAEQLELETQARVSGAEVILCDRGTLDICAHAKLFGQELKPEWLTWTKESYDFVYWLEKSDISFSPTQLQQQISSRDWVTFREELDQHIAQSILDSRLPWQKLGGSLEQRVLTLEQKVRRQLFSIEGQARREKERK
jgi:nicotinamide riboside kinase